jgi:Reverse transcriptase (RNA-dependent DNA polymerase)/GAG-pre-integrase domain/Zinc knuckle
MKNSQLDFDPLDEHGHNYLDWAADCRAFLKSESLLYTIAPGFKHNEESEIKTKDADVGKACLVLRKHLPHKLQGQFRNEENPAQIWNTLKKRFEHIIEMICSRAEEDWTTLRFSNFSTVVEYDTALRSCVSNLEQSGATDFCTDSKLIKKTLSTFPSHEIRYAHSLADQNFKTYDELFIKLLRDEESVRSALRFENANKLNDSTNKFKNPTPKTENPSPNVSFYTDKNTNENNKNNNPNYKGKNFDPNYAINRGKTPYSKPGILKKTGDSSKSVICYRCGESGHIAVECPASWEKAKTYRNTVKNKGKQFPIRHGIRPETHTIIENASHPAPDLDFDVDDLDPVPTDRFSDFLNDECEMLTENSFLTALQLKSFEHITCLVDSCSSQTILTDRKYFESMSPFNFTVTTILSSTGTLGEGRGLAKVKLPFGTIITIPQAIYAPKATRNILCYRDIKRCGTYELHTKDNYLLLKNKKRGMMTMEEFPELPNGVYGTVSYAINESPTEDASKTVSNNHQNDFYALSKNKSETENKCINDTKIHDQIITWHERMGHPSIPTMIKMIEKQSMKGIPFTIDHLKQFKNLNIPCIPCTTAKLIRKPYHTSIHKNCRFMSRLHIDICGPIHPPSGPYRYFMPIIEERSRKATVILLQTKNEAFINILKTVFALQTKFPSHPLQSIRLDNAAEFQSKSFLQYCSAHGICLEFSTAYEHQQNGLAENYIKRIQHIARSMLMQCNLPMNSWGHAVLHANTVTKYWPHSSLDFQSPAQVEGGYTPDVQHLRKFGCTVYIPMNTPERTKMGPQRRGGAYLGNISNSIIKYLQPKTNTEYTAIFKDCVFDEHTFPYLDDALNLNENELYFDDWPAKIPTVYDHPTADCDTEVYSLLKIKYLTAVSASNALHNANDHDYLLKVMKMHQSNAKNVSTLPTVQKPAYTEIQKKDRGRPPKNKNTEKLKSANSAENNVAKLPKSHTDVETTDNAEKTTYKSVNEQNIDSLSEKRKTVKLFNTSEKRQKLIAESQGLKTKQGNSSVDETANQMQSQGSIPKIDNPSMDGNAKTDKSMQSQKTLTGQGNSYEDENAKITSNQYFKQQPIGENMVNESYTKLRKTDNTLVNVKMTECKELNKDKIDKNTEPVTVPKRIRSQSKSKGSDPKSSNLQTEISNNNMNRYTQYNNNSVSTDVSVIPLNDNRREKDEKWENNFLNPKTAGVKNTARITEKDITDSQLDESLNNDNNTTETEEVLIPNDEIIICATETYERNSTNNIISRIKFEINDDFIYATAIDVMNEPEKIPQNINECKQSTEWSKWQEAIKSEITSLIKRGTFSGPLETPENKTVIGCRWVFVKKRGENNTVIRFKARLVAQGFSQRPGVDYNETYSPVMDITSYRYLISLSLTLSCNIHIMDVVTAFLYGDLDKEIYMKVPEGINIPSGIRKPSLKLVKSLYGLKQAGRLWYYRLANFLLRNLNYKRLDSSPCIFVKGDRTKFVIISIYVDDLNLIGTEKEISETKTALSKEFEMKDLGLGTYCLGVEITRVAGGVLVHQKSYIENILKRYNMQTCNPVNHPLQVRNNKKEKDIYCSIKPDEKPLSNDTPYLSAIGSLLYLANTTRPDISFSVNFLARFSQQPTKRHWDGVKQILKYLKGTADTGLFYKNTRNNRNLVGYADAGYVSDSKTGQSQTGYIFMSNNAAVSWRSVKQTTVATSTNHAEIIALYEASRECVWLRKLTNELKTNLGIIEPTPKTVLFEDNAACVAQVTGGYIQSDKTKHLETKLFWTNQQTESEIEVLTVSSQNNLADLFTKILPAPRHNFLCKEIGLRSLRLLKKIKQD